VTAGGYSLAFLEGSSVAAAQRLLGCVLERNIAGYVVRAKIVETEAYDQADVASHSYAGRTPRTDVMFGPAGHLYVYFTYGKHYCCNIVVGPAGHGAAVLLRGAEPLSGFEYMETQRQRRGIELTNGPAKLCQALSIDRTMNGHDLRIGELRLLPQSELPEHAIVQTTRIGITKGKDLPWRFYITDNPYVSQLAKFS
jgi:DNA-3-methyladenine glycosylase